MQRKIGNTFCDNISDMSDDRKTTNNFEGECIGRRSNISTEFKVNGAYDVRINLWTDFALNDKILK